MRSCVVVVAAFAAVLWGAPGCLAGSLDSSISENGAPGIEATSGLLSSDLSNSKSTRSCPSGVEAAGPDQTATGKLNTLLNDPSQLAAAPGSSAAPASASPTLPGATTACGLLDPGTLPGNPQNSSGLSCDKSGRSDVGLGNRGNKISAGGAPGPGSAPVAKDDALLTPPIRLTGSSLGCADTFRVSFGVATDKPNSPARRVLSSGNRRRARRGFAPSVRPVGAAVSSCLFTLCLLGLAAIPLAARCRRHGSA